jgi:hypothetical protein
MISLAIPSRPVFVAADAMAAMLLASSACAPASSLESGATNKGGDRLRALARINQAIDDVRSGIDYAS